MTTTESLLLIRMLRYQGQLGDEDLEKVLELSESARDHHELLEAVAKLNVVESGWLERAEIYLKNRSRSRSDEATDLFRIDRSFGQIALEKDWVSLGDLERALLEQERLRRVHLFFRLGEVLVSNRMLTPEQVRDILKEQGQISWRCEPCDLVVSGTGKEPVVLCPTCGEALVHPCFLEIVRPDVPLSTS